jgi:transposase-like protein
MPWTPRIKSLGTPAMNTTELVAKRRQVPEGDAETEHRQVKYLNNVVESDHGKS